MTTNELLPCPFCGADAGFLAYNDEEDAIHYAGCGNCGARTKRVSTKAEAIAAWNRRVEPDGRLREALADGLKFLEAACEVIENYNGNADDARHYIENARTLLAEPQANQPGKWVLREVLFDDDGQPLSHREPQAEQPVAWLDEVAEMTQEQWLSLRPKAEPDGWQYRTYDHEEMAWSGWRYCDPTDIKVFEQCPNEMTPEQIENWKAHQKPAPLTVSETIAIQNAIREVKYGH